MNELNIKFNKLKNEFDSNNNLITLIKLFDVENLTILLDELIKTQNFLSLEYMIVKVKEMIIIGTVRNLVERFSIFPNLTPNELLLLFNKQNIEFKLIPTYFNQITLDRYSHLINNLLQNSLFELPTIQKRHLIFQEVGVFKKMALESEEFKNGGYFNLLLLKYEILNWVINYFDSLTSEVNLWIKYCLKTPLNEIKNIDNLAKTHELYIKKLYCLPKNILSFEQAYILAQMLIYINIKTGSNYANNFKLIIPSSFQPSTGNSLVHKKDFYHTEENSELEELEKETPFIEVWPLWSRIHY